MTGERDRGNGIGARCYPICYPKRLSHPDPTNGNPLKPLGFRGLYGAQGRNRTTDTAIFSRMLYQLSYLGTGVLGQEEALIEE
jgi:hypothetical protein